MQQSTFSDWGCSLFAKAIEAPSFRAGSVHWKKTRKRQRNGDHNVGDRRMKIKMKDFIKLIVKEDCDNETILSIVIGDAIDNDSRKIPNYEKQNAKYSIVTDYKNI